ncbi:glycoside hydrolase family 38 C-terminal domain-containing protein [Gryllotalpicola daejeonensis]|uniref:Glycoside hydrolase family 38 C-terminal domain-containing protein n=1 Tax=Gryllotalpicola daejeonensis TaxID=993087 RepID=A0ABP7ZJA7_9MICO
MHDDSALVRARIQRFLLERIAPAVHLATAPLEIAAWEVPDEPVPFAEATAAGASYAPFALGTAWGRPWGTTWFHVTGDVPDEWADAAAGRAVAEVVVDLGFSASHPGFQAEGLVWSPDGVIVKAIEPRNDFVPAGAPGERVDLYLEAASNPSVEGGWLFQPTPLGDKLTAGDAPIYELRRLELALRDTEVWQLQQEATALLGLADVLGPRTTRGAEILRALEDLVDGMDPRDIPGTAAAGRAALRPILEKPANASAHRVTAVGHAHIDSAWLWPVRETVRKVARTFSNVLQLMDEDPEFVFAASSAAQYQWMKDSYPELFERIRARVDEGRFVPVGGMWVESDTNLPGGEALARQFVAGTRFFQREFGVDTETVWLPDSFGYTGALPQIARAAGAQFFLTQKISWNETDVFPHHSFQWEGIDGTRIFTHFPPVNTYNSDLSAAELARSEANYAEKGRANAALVPFGYGDGGGGPTREMIAAGRVAADLEGSPRVRFATPGDFFRDAAAEYPDAPVWSGELYLEFHRGTYTSQARTKRGNRRSEHLLREAELWSAQAAVRAGAEYPYDELEVIWQTVLLNQFHDILPGSAIAWVYRVAEAEYARIAAQLEAVIERALAALAGAGDGGRRAAVANAGPFARDGVAPGAIGAAIEADAATAHPEGDGFVLENSLARFLFDAAGRLVSAVDAASGREAVPPGQRGAELQLFRDTPTQWDAWDVDRHYRRDGVVLDAPAHVELTATDAGPELRVSHRVGESRIDERITVVPGTATLQLALDVDWHERQRLLKLAFPVDVQASQAQSEIQFGHISRPLAENTSWDFARFETSAHRWVHVGEAGYGAVVANDAIYGHDITRVPREGGGVFTLVRQSLLRAPLFPDPESDQGAHRFTATFTPGAGIAEAIREGYRVNLPTRPAVGEVAPLVAVNNPAVVIEAVKLAEDRSGDVIVRLYESRGGRAAAAVELGFAAAEVYETDLLEQRVEAHALSGDAGSGIRLTVRPFEIVTLRVRRE